MLLVKGWKVRREAYGGIVRNTELQPPVDEFIYDTSSKRYVGLLKTCLPPMSFVPSPMEIKLHLEKNSSAWCLHADSDSVDAKLVIDNIELRVLRYAFIHSFIHFEPFLILSLFLV